MTDRRIKITGFYTPDDQGMIDPDHSSGMTSEGFDHVHDVFMSLEDIETELERD